MSQWAIQNIEFKKHCPTWSISHWICPGLILVVECSMGLWAGRFPLPNRNFCPIGCHFHWAPRSWMVPVFVQWVSPRQYTELPCRLFLAWCAWTDAQCFRNCFCTGCHWRSRNPCWAGVLRRICASYSCQCFFVSQSLMILGGNQTGFLRKTECRTGHCRGVVGYAGSRRPIPVAWVWAGSTPWTPGWARTPCARIGAGCCAVAFCARWRLRQPASKWKRLLCPEIFIAEGHLVWVMWLRSAANTPVWTCHECSPSLSPNVRLSCFAGNEWWELCPINVVYLHVHISSLF